MFWWLLSSLLALFTYLKFWKPYNYWEKEGVFYLKPWPFFGNLLLFSLRRISLFYLIDKFYNFTNLRYFGIYQFLTPVLVIRDVELAKQICIKDFEHFVDHKGFFSETDEPVLSENLLAAKGQTWRKLRATISPVFTGSKLRAMFFLISQCSERFSKQFLQSATGIQPLEIEVKETFKRFTVDVIGTCVYGVENNSFEEKNNFYENSKDVSDFTGLRGLKAVGFLICPALMRAVKIWFFSKDQVDFFREIVTKTIDFREKNGIVRPDLIHIMMQARKRQLESKDEEKYSGFVTPGKSKNRNVKLDITDNLIIAQALAFFIGGTDTTSTLLSITAYELALNIDIQKKLQNEIDKVYELYNSTVTYEVVAHIKYMDMVIKESMRKWPPAYFLDRFCKKDYIVKPTQLGEKSYVIKKGQMVWIPVISFHRDPTYYPDPLRFDPERFSEENKHNINPYAYLPFGQGPRKCIGSRFALMVTKIFLFHILHEFSFVVTKKTNVPLQIDKSQLVLNFENGAWLGLQKR